MVSGALSRISRSRSPEAGSSDWLSRRIQSCPARCLYCIFPNRPVRAASALPGAFSAAVLWMLFTRLFSTYAERFGHYSLYYGSLSVMALAMLWLYICMFLLFCGGILNCELERRAAAKRGRPEI